MSITTANGSSPQDFYWAKDSDIPPAQVLSQAGNTVSLSGGGGSVNVASTTSVALSAQKTTAITYNTGLLETNVSGVLNVGLGSAIGSTRVEGGNVVISRTDAPPALEFTSGANTGTIEYDASGSIFGNPALITNVNEFQVATGATTRVAMGYDAGVSASYVSASGGNLFLGEAGANSYSGILLGDLGTGGLFLDRKDDTNVTQSAATMVLTGTGQINIETSLATGGIGISTLAAANIGISSGQGVAVSAATDIILQAPSGDITMNVGNAAGRINLTGGTALITTVPPIGITGNYLLLTINSVTYKIALVT
jgi:hypothetical protein